MAPRTPASVADLELALDLADVADGVTVAAFRRPDLPIETKADATPVTEADRAAEQAIRLTLTARRPGDAVIGEELGSTGGGERRWIVDPIDGTKNFVRGIPVWATLIALEDGGQMVLGVVSAPALGRRWWAGRGLGSFASDLFGTDSAATPIHVSAVPELGHAQVSGASLDGWDERGMTTRAVDLMLRCGRDRGFGDFWSHMLVAEGACDIGLDPVASLWDLAALQVIVEEAGGRFTDLEGAARADGGCAISTNGLLHDRVLEVLAGPA